MKNAAIVFALIYSAAFAQRAQLGDRDIAGNLTVGGNRTSLSKGTTPPATCTVGDVFFDTDATAGSNWFGCTATNTWTLMSGGGGGGGVTITRTTVSFSATPTFTRSSALQSWKITLTGNVTSSTTSGLVAGDYLTFEVCQDGTGGRTFAWPTGFANAGVVNADASRCTVFLFQWDGTNAIPDGSPTPYGGATGAFLDFSHTTSGRTRLQPSATTGTVDISTPNATSMLATLALSETLTNKTLIPTILRLPNSTTLPGTCTVGDIYMDTDATSGQRIYACQSTNTWALQGDGGSGGGGLDLSTVGHCFFSDGCAYPAHTIALFSGLANRVYMVQVVIPATLKRGSAKVFVYDGGTSGQAAAFAIHADSSNAPGAQLATWRVVDWSSSRYVSVTLDAATQSAGVFWLAWAAEVATLRSYTRSFGDAFLGNAGPLMVNCSNTATGTGGSYALPSTCGTASAEGNIPAPVVMIAP